jgi:hypothetical protein
MKQYRDKLLIYSQSDVYMVSKADLIEQTTSISEKSLTPVAPGDMGAIYDLSGRKVSSQSSHSLPAKDGQGGSLRKGLYIQNGKKVAVK